MPGNPMNPNNRNQRGSGFTNLNRIVGANKQNQLGSAVGSGLTQQAQVARQGLQKGTEQFNQQAQQNRLDTEQNKQAAQNILNAPESVSDQDVSKFQTLRSGQYSGPQALQNEQGIVNQARQAEQLGRYSGSSGGRQMLLQRFLGGSGYTAGKQRLDDLLLGQTGTQQLRQAQRQTANLGQSAERASEGARTQAQYLANQAKQFGQNVENQYDTTVQNQGQQLQSALEKAKADQEAQLARLKGGIQGANELTPEEMARFGIDPNTALFNVDLSKYVSRTMDPNLANVSSQEQARKIQALQKLGASNIDENQRQLFSAFQDPSQVNQLAVKGLTGVDKDTIRKELLARNKEFEEGLAPRHLSAAQKGLGQWSEDISNYAGTQGGILDSINQTALALENSKRGLQSTISQAMSRNNYNQQRAMQDPEVLKQQDAIKSYENQIQNLQNQYGTTQKTIQDRLSSDKDFAEKWNNQLALINAPDQSKSQGAVGFLNQLLNPDYAKTAAQIQQNNQWMSDRGNAYQTSKDVENLLNNFRYFKNWYGDDSNAFKQWENKYKGYLKETGADQTLSARQADYKKQQEEQLKKAQQDALQQLATGK